MRRKKPSTRRDIVQVGGRDNQGKTKGCPSEIKNNREGKDKKKQFRLTRLKGLKKKVNQTASQTFQSLEKTDHQP